MCATLWRDASAGQSRAHECYAFEGLPGRRLWQCCRRRRYFRRQSLQNAIANGDTRTISFHHIHLKEDTTITFKVNGKYDQAALKKVSYALRDWRTGNPTDMDPHLIDALWEVYRETGAKEPIHVIGGYRSPATNAMLRRRSSGVAKFSQHMLGKALDFYIPDVPLESIRDAGLRLQRGGVGFYPSSARPSSTWTSAACGTGRGCRKPNSPASCPRLRPPAWLRTARRRSRRPAPTVVAARNVRDEDEDAEVVVTRPAQRGRVTASVAPQPQPETVAAVPMPKSRPGAIAAESAPSGFNLASASSQPVRLPIRQNRVNRNRVSPSRVRRRLRLLRPAASISPRPRRSRFRRRRVRPRPQA